MTDKEVRIFEKKFKWYKIYSNPGVSTKHTRYAYFWNLEGILRHQSVKEGKL